MEENKTLPEILSNKQIRKLRPVILRYSRALGIPTCKKRLSAKQHLIRICNQRKQVAVEVRPEGGKITPYQSAKLLRYMVENPQKGFELTVEESLKLIDRKEKPHHASLRKRIRKATAEERTRKAEFYKSWEWSEARYRTLQKHGAKCMACGATKEDAKIVVDHILPLHTHWELRSHPDNLQVLCHLCNMGKGAWDQTDWRPR